MLCTCVPHCDVRELHPDVKSRVLVNQCFECAQRFLHFSIAAQQAAWRMVVCTLGSPRVCTSLSARLRARDKGQKPVLSSIRCNCCSTGRPPPLHDAYSCTLGTIKHSTAGCRSVVGQSVSRSAQAPAIAQLTECRCSWPSVSKAASSQFAGFVV